uniref:Osteoclast-stimulating factor 1 n=1 Tax=Oncorhynchus mykiss TaxID=8022 RepID=A0A8K9UWB3_ONCMY
HHDLLNKFSKNGEHFCKELMTVFQQRYGQCQLLENIVYRDVAWIFSPTESEELIYYGLFFRALGSAFQAEAILEIRQVIEEHNKRKRPLDNVVERNAKLVVTNWSEQIKMKKKLVGLTREHEALFNFVEKNTRICTEKEKQKMLTRLTKSAEAQTRTDEEYFTINMDGHEIRLKWENTLKNCYQIIQEVEKQRIEVLCNILSKYNLHMASFRHTLVHRQKQIEQAIQKVDVEKDILNLVEETSVTAEENKAKFLMTDYFEEDSKSLMEKDRRRDAIKSKLQRLGDSIAKTKKDCEGLERLVKTYSENPSFSNKNNLEETEQLIDETTLKLNLLEATHCKLSSTLAELEGKPKTLHRFSASITKWKEKDCEHSIVQLSRPVKIKKTPFRSRLRSSIIYKGPPQSVTSAEASSVEVNKVYTAVIQDTAAPGECAEWCSIGKCKAVYDFTSDRDDELNMKEGDLLDIYQKEDSGWWYGILNGQIGHFPSTYIEELPMLSVVETSDV